MNALALLFSALVAAESSPWLIWSQQGPSDAVSQLVAGRPGQTRRIGSLPVRPDHEPRLALSKDGAWLLATTSTGRDPELGATLWRIRLSTGEATRVAEGVSYSKPLALPDGRGVFLRVAAFTPAAAESSPLDFEGRTVEVQALDADGTAKRLAAFDCLGLHLAGVFGDRVVVYAVTRDEASFHAVSLSGSFPPRRLAATPAGPFARDFSVAGSRLVFASLRPASRDHAVYALDLDDGQLRVLVETGADEPMPLASGARFVYTRRGGAGHELLSSNGETAEPQLATRGLPVALAIDGAGHLVAFRKQLSAAQQLWWFDATARQAHRLETLRHFTVAGFAELP